MTDFEVSLKGGEYDMTSRRRAQLSKLPLRSDEVQYASLGALTRARVRAYGIRVDVKEEEIS